MSKKKDNRQNNKHNSKQNNNNMEASGEISPNMKEGQNTANPKK